MREGKTETCRVCWARSASRKARGQAARDGGRRTGQQTAAEEAKVARAEGGDRDRGEGWAGEEGGREGSEGSELLIM